LTGIWILAALTSLVVALGVVEYAVHRRNLRRIPLRIHVNGTRGKSSVTRLVAAGLTAGGVRTCAKTTGTQARMILPDGREVPVLRATAPNVIEQTRIVAVAVAHDAEALVTECMALRPSLQWLSEARLVWATHGVITNARPDHLDVMGPEDEDVALALAGMVPPGRRLYTAETRHLPVIEAACRDREAELVAVGAGDVAAVGPEDLAGFSHLEHADNVALALRICADLGVERETALSGMWAAAPDPGALTEHVLDGSSGSIHFVNGFAANDPVSTERLWRQALERHPDVERRVALLNLRADRPDRSLLLGRTAAGWPPADSYVLVGSGTDLFARAAAAAGIDPARLVFAEEQAVDEVFETVVRLCDRSSLVMGMGSMGGRGLELAALFRDRSRLGQEAA